MQPTPWVPLKLLQHARTWGDEHVGGELVGADDTLVEREMKARMDSKSILNEY